MGAIKFDFNKFSKVALGEIGDVLVEQAQANMDEVSNGRVYIVGGKAHIASKAGDTANNMSGKLKSTIRFEIQGTVLEFGAGDEITDYAKWLELSTKNMAVRPNYTKAILQSKIKINAIISKEFMRNVRFSR